MVYVLSVSACVHVCNSNIVVFLLVAHAQSLVTSFLQEVCRPVQSWGAAVPFRQASIGLDSDVSHVCSLCYYLELKKSWGTICRVQITTGHWEFPQEFFGDVQSTNVTSDYLQVYIRPIEVENVTHQVQSPVLHSAMGLFGKYV